LRVDFIRDFSGYVDNLLAPEKRATNPSSSDIINGFGLENDNQYNEFQKLTRWPFNIRGNFCTITVLMATATTHCLSTIHNVGQVAQVLPLIMATPRFIQMGLPLPPLKPMDQSRRGVIRIMEVLHRHLTLHPIKYRAMPT
jgi:hypothetical protein